MCDLGANTSNSVGLANNALGTFFASKEKQIAYGAEASTDQINAKLAEVSAQSALNMGARQQQAILLKGAQVRAGQQVGYAAGNIDASSESAIETKASSKLMAQNDAYTANANAVRAAWGYRMTAVSDQNAALFAKTAQNTISPLLMTAAQINTDRWKLQYAGALPSNMSIGNFDPLGLSIKNSGDW